MDWENKYCEYDYNYWKQSVCWMQILYQNSNDILHRDKKIHVKVHIKAQKGLNEPKQFWTKRITQEESQYPTSNYTTSHGNNNSTVPAQKQTWRPMEQKRRLTHKLIQLKALDFWQRSPKHGLMKR
jgi:hypothetical protein